MSAYSKLGDKVVFIDMNGYESERAFARKHLIVNKIYEVESVDIGSFSSTVKLVGINEKFNTVMFSPYQEPTKDE